MDTWESRIFVQVRAVEKNVLGHTIKKVKKFRKQDIFDGIDWAQQNPEKISNIYNFQTSVKKASIHSTAKKLMAREWALAWGKTSEQNADCFEQEAVYWKRIMERKKIV